MDQGIGYDLLVLWIGVIQSRILRAKMLSYLLLILYAFR